MMKTIHKDDLINYTPEEIMTMDKGPLLDGLVAELLGHRVFYQYNTNGGVTAMMDQGHSYPIPVEPYSTHMASSWPLAKREKMMLRPVGTKWTATSLDVINERELWGVTKIRAEHAIALMFVLNERARMEVIKKTHDGERV